MHHYCHAPIKLARLQSSTVPAGLDYIYNDVYSSVFWNSQGDPASMSAAHNVTSLLDFDFNLWPKSIKSAPHAVHILSEGVAASANGESHCIFFSFTLHLDFHCTCTLTVQ